MITPSPAHWQASRRFLGCDRERFTAAQCGEAASHLHERLRLGLAPLIGAGGFAALFARSVKLGATGLVGASLRTLGMEPTIKGREELSRYLSQQQPTVAAEIAAAVFATFFALMTNFIGEELTARILTQIGFPLTETPGKESDQ